MGCSHDCSSCGSDCSTKNKESMIKPLNEKSSVKKVIGVVSGKGGGGKSLVTAMLAVNMDTIQPFLTLISQDLQYPRHSELKEKFMLMRTELSLQEQLRV